MGKPLYGEALPVGIAFLPTLSIYDYVHLLVGTATYELA